MTCARIVYEKPQRCLGMASSGTTATSGCPSPSVSSNAAASLEFGQGLGRCRRGNASFGSLTRVACPSGFSFDAGNAPAQSAVGGAGSMTAFDAKIVRSSRWDTFRRKRLRMGGNVLCAIAAGDLTPTLHTQSILPGTARRPHQKSAFLATRLHDEQRCLPSICEAGRQSA